MFLSLSSKTKLVLDKIFTTVSSTAFVHMWRYSQHKMKVPQRGLKTTYNKI